MSLVVLAYSENESVAAEVSAAASELARQGGGTSLTLTSHPEVTAEVAAEALMRSMGPLKASVVVVGGTRSGRETAARLAAKLKGGCIADASKLAIDGGKLVGVRSAYAGKVVAKVSCGFPAVATVKVGAFQKAATPAESKSLDVEGISQKATVVGRTPKVMGSVDLKSAKVIVSAGRGVKKKEDLKMLEDLASRMKGALGCSRPLSSDLGWLPEEHHIGLTGVTVKPDLYLAVGISGQLQHVAGIRDSKVIAAINTDKDAPIFQASDYGVVGDLYQVVPAMMKALASRS